jgi:uncharacterized peroxidase-related enzyme
MPRIAALNIEAAPEASRSALNAMQKKIGRIPNLFRVFANSPAALNGYLGLSNTLASGMLDAKTQDRIALAVAELNGCGYCLSAHTYLGKHVSKLEDDEIMANRKGASHDQKADAAVKFAVTTVRERGHVSDADFNAVRDAGFNDAEIVEIVLQVALNTLTNYVNEVAKTDVDFPVVVQPLSSIS